MYFLMHLDALQATPQVLQYISILTKKSNKAEMVPFIKCTQCCGACLRFFKFMFLCVCRDHLSEG